MLRLNSVQRTTCGRSPDRRGGTGRDRSIKWGIRRSGDRPSIELQSEIALSETTSLDAAPELCSERNLWPISRSAWIDSAQYFNLLQFNWSHSPFSTFLCPLSTLSDSSVFPLFRLPSHGPPTSDFRLRSPDFPLTSQQHQPPGHHFCAVVFHSRLVGPAAVGELAFHQQLAAFAHALSHHLGTAIPEDDVVPVGLFHPIA